jgi:hypothetical protein
MDHDVPHLPALGEDIVDVIHRVSHDELVYDRDRRPRCTGQRPSETVHPLKDNGPAHYHSQFQERASLHGSALQRCVWVICRTEPHEQAPSPKISCPIPPTTSFYMTVPPLKAPCCHNRGMLPSRLSEIYEPNAAPQLRLEAAA